MSLIHWWPLNGDTKDYGLVPVEMKSLSYSTLTNNGKIGQCYGNTSYTGGGYVSTTKISTGTKLSMFAWIKITQLTASSTLGGAILGTHRYPTNTGMGLTIRYVSATTGYLSVNTGTGSSRTYNTYYGSTLLQANTWYHVGFTYDEAQIKLYVNGLLDGTFNYSGMSQPDDFAMIGCWSLANSTLTSNAVYDNYKLYGFINDCRIYNHVLSTSEIKEISKALILHYDFEDSYIEGTTNLLTGSYGPIYQPNTYSSTFQVLTETFNGWPVIRCTGTSSTNSGFRYSITATLAPNDSVTFSLYLRYNTAKTNFLAYFGGYEGGSYRDPLINRAINTPGTTQNSRLSETITLYDAAMQHSLAWDQLVVGTWYYITVTLTNVSSGQITINNYYFLGGSNVSTWDVSCPQIEYKNHATPFVNGTRSQGIIYDSSGYNYNGTCIGDCQIVPEANNGTTSLLNNSTNIGTSTSTGAAYIKTDLGTELSPTQLTIAFWANVVQYNYQNSGILSFSYISTAPTDYLTYGIHQYDSKIQYNCATGSKSLNSDLLIEPGVWHYYTLVYNGTNLYSYRDGMLKETVACACGAINPFRYLYLGLNVAGGAWRQSKEKWADFKVYTTALSAEDILTEYQRKVAIDKNGNIFTGRFIETTIQSIPKVNKNDTFSASSLSEGLITQVLSDGSIWERVYYFDYDIAGAVWTKATAQFNNTLGRFSILGSLNSYVPKSGWYEFYYKEKNSTSTNDIRWKQSFNPLSRVTSGVSGTSSEYTFISGTNPHSQFAGITRYTSSDENSCYLRGAPSWWCAIAPYQTSYDVFPDMWGNSVNNHHQELWIRIDDMIATPTYSNTQAKLNSTSIMCASAHEI